MRTLVVIPAWNEAAALPGVLAELREAAPDVDVLVVDDGSTDATADVARRAGAFVVRLPFNLGIGGALRTGFRFAVDHGYSRAVQFDADGQHDPSELAALFEELDRGADLVIGSRFASEQHSYSVSPVRGHAMALLRVAVNLLVGQRFTDTSSGFRAFSRPMLEYFARTYPVEYMDSVEALLLACYAGFCVVEVPARMRTRAAGAASNRNVRLLYHYVRLLIVMLSQMSFRRARPRAAP